MPTDGEAANNNRKLDVASPGRVVRQDSKLCRQDSLRLLTRQESKRKESAVGGAPRGGGGGEGKLGQPMESSNNGLKSSGLFGFVHYFMDRPDASSQTSGASTPSTPAVSTNSTTPLQVPLLETSLTRRSSQPNSNSSGASPDPELDKNEVFSDGSKSDKSDAQRSESRLEQPSHNSRTYIKSEEYRQLFHLPPEEVLVEDFNCALQKKILLQGHMYLFERYVCFYSNIFGYEKKKIIPLKDITSVRKAKTAGVFPNAIEITSWGKKHFFASFLSRDEAYRLIINGWLQHSGYARMFLGSHYSPMSSPGSQGRNSIDSGGMSSSWRSPLRAASLLQPEETDAPRTTEEVPNLVAPSAEEVRDVGSLEETVVPGDGENSAEGLPDERLSVNESSSISTTSIAPLWEPEDSDAPGLPEGYKTVVETEFAVDVREFFQLFFSDDAVGFFKGFHTKCGDDDFRCTQWAKHRHFGQARDISFRHPINFYFGPKSTYCHESQRFRVYRNNHLVLETSQQMTDIPYGDYFRVEVRWDVERLCGKGSYHCFVRISLGVTFCKKTVWKGKIEQGTHDESKEAYTTWIHEAHSVLRDMRALAVEAGAVKNAAMRPGSDNGEYVGEMVSLDDAVLEEDEEPVHRIQEEDSLLEAPSIQTEPRGSDFRGGQRWKKKGSALFETLVLISQKIWDKSYNLDFKTNKQLKLVCFILIAIMIVLMQVGIMIALARPPKVQYFGVGYPNGPVSAGSCCGGPKGDEALAWLEQRTRHVKEEIMLAEARLQTLHQDLAVLKAHVGHLLSNVVDKQYDP